MTEISFETMINGWVEECGKGAVFPPPEFYAINREHFFEENMRGDARLQTGGDRWVENNYQETAESIARYEEMKKEWERANPKFVLRVGSEDTFTFQQEKGRVRPLVELGRHIGRRHAKNSVVLLNGDGFDNVVLQQTQARLRQAVQGRFTRTSMRMIVPYAALQSAQLDLSSIVPIHIAADRNVTVIVKVPKPPKKLLTENTTDGRTAGTKVFIHKNRQYRGVWVGWPHPGQNRFEIMYRPEFADREGWHAVRRDPEDPEWWVIRTHVHRLGTTVFSATGPDGKRHRWISSFDQNETPPMYFLAQLPDKGGIRYVTHAERLLAPRIVHKARQDGRQVFRQGDIFAIETDLKDEDFSLNEIVLRPQVFEYQDLSFPQSLTIGVNTVGVTGNGTQWVLDTTESFTILSASVGPASPMVANGWVTSTTTPAGRWVLRAEALTKLGLRLRKRLMIYRTGHTASMVAVTSYGTFVKGTMYHDPILENIRAGRQPEHTPLILGDGNKWYLAVRNSVPRQQTTTDTGGNTDAVDSVPNMPDTQPRKRGVPEPELQGRPGGRNRRRVTANV